MAGRNRSAGKNEARRPQRFEEKAFLRASLAMMEYRALHPTHVRSFAEPEPRRRRSYTSRVHQSAFAGTRPASAAVGACRGG